jgi:DNA-binding protein HU-beta
METRRHDVKEKTTAPHEGLNKETLITHVADKAGLSKADAKKAVEEVFAAVSDCLARGEKFQYIGFGSFGVKSRAARLGINPATKEKMEIKARKVPHFTPGKKLSERIK